MLGTKVPGSQGNFLDIQAGVTHVHALTHLCTDSFHKTPCAHQTPEWRQSEQRAGWQGTHM